MVAWSEYRGGFPVNNALVPYADPIERCGCAIARCQRYANWRWRSNGVRGSYEGSKNERANIDKDEQEALKKLATHLLSLTAQAVGTAQREGELIEVNCGEKD